MRTTITRIACTTICLAVATPLFAQDDAGEGGATEKPKGPSLRERYDVDVTSFAIGPAGVLLTAEEVAAFRAFTDRSERRAFINEMWFEAAANCEPGENPVRDAFWERAESAAANPDFDREGVPGWLTDRGRVFSILGPPSESKEVDAKIDGVLGSALVWTYLDEEGGSQTITFLPTRNGWQLVGIDLHDPTAESPAIFREEFSSISSVTERLARDLRDRGCALSAEEIAKRERTAWRTELWNAADEFVSGSAEPLSEAWSARWFFFPAAEGSTLSMFTLAHASELEEGERLVALLRDPSNPDPDFGLTLGGDEFSFETTPAGEGWLSQSTRALPPGRYAVVAGVVNQEGSLERHFSGEQIVVALPQEQFRMSSVIVAEEFEQLAADDGPAPFTLGGFRVVPRLENTVRAGDELTIFFQVIGASGEATGASELRVSYQLHGRPPSGEWQRLGQPIVSQQPGAVRVWSLPISAAFRPADYKIEIQVVDQPTGLSVSNEVYFRVES